MRKFLVAALGIASCLAVPAGAQDSAHKDFGAYKGRPLTPLDDATIKQGGAIKQDAAIKGEVRGIKGESRAIKGETQGDGTTGILIGLTPKPEASDASKANPGALGAGVPGAQPSSQFKYADPGVNLGVQKVQPAPLGAGALAPPPPGIAGAPNLPAVQAPAAQLPAVQAPAAQLPAVQAPALQQTAPALQGGAIGAPMPIKK